MNLNKNETLLNINADLKAIFLINGLFSEILMSEYLTYPTNILNTRA